MTRILLNMLKLGIVIWLIICGTWFMLGKIFFSIYQTIILISGILIGLLFFKIKPPDKSTVEEIIGRDPAEEDNGAFLIKTIAHRGAGLDAPENTLAAFKNCKNKGCQAIEVDLSLTEDGVPIIFHDNDLLRLTGENISIKKTSWLDLSKIDLSQKHPMKERFPNTGIAKFDEVLDYVIESDLRIIIDLKDTDERALAVIFDAFKKRPNLYKRAIVSGFNPLALYTIRRKNPKIVCSMAYRPFFFSHGNYTGLKGPSLRRSNNFVLHRGFLFMDALWEFFHPWIADMIGLSAILLQKDTISMEKIQYWKARNIRVMSWTVNQPAEKLFHAKCLKITYLTDTFIGETTAHSESLLPNLVNSNSVVNYKQISEAARHLDDNEEALNKTA